MSNNILTKNYTAEGTIGACLIVKGGSNDYGVLQASAGADKTLGITVADISTYASGDSVDVVVMGIADLTLGGTVARGDLLMSDANGCGIVAAAAGGSNVRVIGRAEISGVSGDIIPVLVLPSMFQG